MITQYPRTFPYGGVTVEYTGTNATLEKVTTNYARKLTLDLTVQVSILKIKTLTILVLIE